MANLDMDGFFPANKKHESLSRAKSDALALVRRMAKADHLLYVRDWCDEAQRIVRELGREEGK